MHTCPECGQLCCCKGDIEDVDWGEDRNCVHSLYDEDCDGFEGGDDGH